MTNETPSLKEWIENRIKEIDSLRCWGADEQVAIKLNGIVMELQRVLAALEDVAGEIENTPFPYTREMTWFEVFNHVKKMFLRLLVGEDGMCREEIGAEPSCGTTAVSTPSSSHKSEGGEKEVKEMSGGLLCPFCGLAMGSSNGAKGMLAMHIKHKHPDTDNAMDSL